jgi:hypothetical protein
MKLTDLTLEDARVIGQYRGKPSYIDLPILYAFYAESSRLIMYRAIDKARRAV